MLSVEAPDRLPVPLRAVESALPLPAAKRRIDDIVELVAIFARVVSHRLQPIRDLSHAEGPVGLAEHVFDSIVSRPR